MIQLNDITLQRGSLRLLEKSNLTLYPGSKVGIIGQNGCGKSSLFQMLTGHLPIDQGDLQIPSQWQIAHMAQEAPSSERSAVNFTIDGNFRLHRVQNALVEAEKENKTKELVALHAELDELGGYQAKHRAEKILHGLGFTQHEIGRPVNSFSGGWRIRIKLAQTLMCHSDLMLLDEPTNHLDLEATLWVEQWLRTYPGTLLLISHDRDFLDNVVEHIVHIENRQTINYRGNYSAFENQRAERLAQQQSSFVKQQQRIGEIHRFVSRFRAKATKAKQAQSRLKELAKMELIAPAHIDSPFYFRFRKPEKESTPLIKLDGVYTGYEGTPVLEKINLAIQPGARIGLLGHNGAGKSTLIKCLVGDLEILDGDRICGQYLRIGYFAQHQLEALDPTASAVEHLQDLTPDESEQRLRDFLGGFNFHGDKATEAIAPFSGGEKARLALAIIVWQAPNLLLLDEPTNHLDLEMRHAVTEALQEYSGALMVISHDRHLLRSSVDELYLLADNTLKLFNGNLEDYQLWTKSHPILQNQKHSTNLKLEAQLDKKSQRQQAALQRQKLSPLKSKIKNIEKQIAIKQAKLENIDKVLSDPSLYDEQNKKKISELVHNQGILRKSIESSEEEWITLSEQLESLLN
ncbi:ATP-binding cassette domain-containing protein [Pseudomonadota bacterium]